ncbi:MAG: potassium channel family protein [Wenzhouxiangella sp.]
MSAFTLLFFRRMRVPLVVLICAYAIATIGFTLMPGVDDQGEPWRLNLFEAFYIVSYTGSTIGFGEVPYPFSPAQRLWTMVSIYMTVIAWLFSIGSIISLLQDPAFRASVRRGRFARAVRSIDQPFYLVCGLGDTGRLLLNALSHQGHIVVVIDHNADKIDALSVETHPTEVIAFCLNASSPSALVEAGLRQRWCLGVLAVTGDDKVNLKIAVTAKLLNPRCTVQARADERATAANMRSFDTNEVINPAEEYVRRLRLALTRPASFQLYQWLNSGPDAPRPVSVKPPHGRWVLCGFGRLGRAMHALLVEQGLDVRVIEENDDLPGLPQDAVIGRGTEAQTLEQAGIQTASALLATTRDDVDNLSIVMTARSLNPDLFIAALENGLSSQALFEAAELDFIARPSRVIAGTMLARIASPLMAEFFREIEQLDDRRVEDGLQWLSEANPHGPPRVTTLRISEKRSPAVCRLLEQGHAISLEALTRHPATRRLMPVRVLMHKRSDQVELLPDHARTIEQGDRLLLAGPASAIRRLSVLLENDNSLSWVVTGRELHQGWLWTRLFGAKTA